MSVYEQANSDEVLSGGSIHPMQAINISDEKKKAEPPAPQVKKPMTVSPDMYAQYLASPKEEPKKPKRKTSGNQKKKGSHRAVTPAS